MRTSQEEELRRLDGLAHWSTWCALEQAVLTAPREPGVYLVREGPDGPIVYVGMAGERRGSGIRGRLRVYSSGKAIASGLGEAASDRALADPEWLEERLAEVRAGNPQRVLGWGRAALQRIDPYVRWTTTPDKNAARRLEHQCGAVCQQLWNRSPFQPGVPRSIADSTASSRTASGPHA